MKSWKNKLKTSKAITFKTIWNHMTLLGQHEKAFQLFIADLEKEEPKAKALPYKDLLLLYKLRLEELGLITGSSP